MALVGTVYSYGYNHARKEIIFKLQVGTMPEIQIVMSAEAFIQDLDFVRKDQRLAHFISEIKKRKDLPINYDFGAGGSEIKFNPEEWDKRMGKDA